MYHGDLQENLQVPYIWVLFYWQKKIILFFLTFLQAANHDDQLISLSYTFSVGWPSLKEEVKG